LSRWRSIGRFGLALVIAIPVVALVTRWGERRNAKAEAGIHEAEFETDRRLLEFADQQVVLRSAGIHGTQYQPLASAIAARRKAGRKSLWSSIVSMIPQRIVIDFVFGIAAGLGVLQAVSGDVDPVAIIAVIALTSQVINPLRVLAELLTTLRRAELQLDEVADVLNEPEMAVPELSRAQPADNAVQLDHVIFGYGDRAPVLDGVDLELEPWHGHRARRAVRLRQDDGHAAYRALLGRQSGCGAHRRRRRQGFE
jgi:ATP-binding cassette subfamily B protein